MSKSISFKDLELIDALDLAIQIELEAKERYEEFARQIGSSKANDAGDFFFQMSKNEEKHANELKERREKLFKNQKVKIHLEDLYHHQEIEAPEFDRAESFMSTKKALMVARECEIKAYNFFDQAVKIVSNNEVKELFLELKEEEESHRKMIEELLKKTSGDEENLLNDDDIDGPNGL